MSPLVKFCVLAAFAALGCATPVNIGEVVPVDLSMTAPAVALATGVTGTGTTASAASAETPTDSRSSVGRTMTAQQLKNTNYKGLVPGALQVEAVHLKYNKSVPPPVRVAAAAAVSTGSAGATPADVDVSEYLTPVKIGSQTFKLDFDTGSSDLWVLGSSLQKAGGSHTYYSPGSSSNALNGESWSIQYQDGSGASGTVYTDTVSVGGTTVAGQDVEVAKSATAAFTSGPNDGLLGLAFDNINTCSPNQCSTFFTTAIKGGLPKALFWADLKYHKAGSYGFGYIDQSKYTGAITYTNVDSSQGFWTFTPTGYSIGNGATKGGNANALRGIADTGTTLVYADSTIVRAYWAQVSGAKNSAAQGGYIYPCSSTLPSFSLIINGYKATIPGKYMTYAPNGDGTCFGSLQSDAGIGIAIYGDVFLKSQFVVFDKTQSTPRLGFATGIGKT